MTTISTSARRSGGLLEGIWTLIQALILAVLIQMFLVQPFDIPSGSMEKTLLVGDYLFVDKLAYGYSRYSFSYPLLGLNKGLVAFNGRIWGADPKRGDIVVFRKPHDESIDYIKRVIGLPGDKIQMQKGVLTINGTAVPRKFDKDYDEVDYRGIHISGKAYTETLPNGVSYQVLKMTDDGAANNTPVYEVPPGHFFMMGDNRDDSADSRFLDDVGYVPLDNLIGKARLIYFSHRGSTPVWQFWVWPESVRLDRIGKILG